MSNKLQVWNMALGWVGTRTVSSPTENTPEAIQCNMFWDNARRQVLRDFPWNFAQRRAWLAQITVPEGWEMEYRFAYALPADCVKARQVRSQGGKESRFIIVYNHANQSKVVLTNCEKALLVYTTDVEVDFGDDQFAHLLGRKLASLIAVPLLRNNSGKVQELEQLYRGAIPQAMESDATEGQEEIKPDSWITARGGNL